MTNNLFKIFKRQRATVFCTFCFLLGVIFAASPSVRADGLSAYRGRSRVLLVFAPSRADARYRRQVALLRGESAGMADRDLILRFVGAEATTERRRLGVKPRQFRVILIGKDGHAATSADHPLSPRSLFAQIDAMPMRRDEMSRHARR